MRRLRPRLHIVNVAALIALVSGAAPLVLAGQGSPATAGRVIMLTTQEDRARQMALLGLTSFPPSPQAYQAATYDEATANPYPQLPDALRMKNGTRVTTAAQWRARRAEIVEDMEREIYGRMPPNMPAVEWEIVSTETGLPMGGRGFGAPAAAAPLSDVQVVTKQLVGRVDNSSYPAISVNIGLTLVTPANAKGPVPVIMQFGGGGPSPMPPSSTPNPCAPPAGAGSEAGRGRATAQPPAAAPPAVAGRAGQPAGVVAAGRGANPAAPGRGRGPTGPSWQAQVLAKGWGYALLNTASIQADSGCGLTVGIIGLMNRGQPRKLDDWGTLRALAWGASRALDYFETDRTVDARRVAVEGHSRWGKATIVTIAFDERFATGYVSSSGEGGAKLHRRKYGESVQNMSNAGAYHWLAGNFMKYADRWNDLPVDSHELVALVAPRPVFLSAGSGPLTNPDGSLQLLPTGDPRCLPARGACATQPVDIMDGWVDAKGTFLAGVGASPVYELLGKKGLRTTEFPTIETGLMEGDVAFRQHAGGHTDGPNWPHFLEFAERHFRAIR